MLRVAVLVSGGGTNLQALIDKINDKTVTSAEIVTVISNNQKAYALKRAEQQGIDHQAILKKDYASKEAYTQALISYLREKRVELVVLAGFLVVLSESFIQAFRNRIINIHPSLIPSFCGEGFYGLKVHEEALKRGVKLTGATVHFVDEGTDTGPILLQKAVPVYSEDTPEVLQKRVMEEAEWMLLPQAVHLIANGKVTVRDKKAIITD